MPTNVSLILVWANPSNIAGDSLIFLGGFGKADFCTRDSLAFIKTTIFPTLSLKVGVVRNCRGLVYLKAIPQWLLSIAVLED